MLEHQPGCLVQCVFFICLGVGTSLVSVLAWSPHGPPASLNGALAGAAGLPHK